MLATGDRLEELYLYFALDLILAKIGRADLYLIPFESAAFGTLDL